MTSSITRVVRHLTGINCTNNCGACTKVPKRVRDKLIMENFPALHKGKASTNTQDALQDALLGEFGDPSTQAQEGFAPRNMQEERDDNAVHVPRQTTLALRVHSQSWVREPQKVAMMEIAQTLVECNMSFNVLRTEQ